jgi:hypothetical protein
MILLTIGMGSAHGQALAEPTLPQQTVNLTLPSQGSATCPTLSSGSNCIRNVPAANAKALQSAINAATCGDTIVLAAGSTYSGNFTIPSTSCSGWIEIVSSGLANLPPSGNRVGPANVANMATISTPNSSSAIQFLPSSNHWRLIGLEVTTSAKFMYFLITLGLTTSSTEVTVQSQLPAYVILDHLYIHGLASETGSIQEGVRMDTQAFGIVDSYCDEIGGNGLESQCFLSSGNGVGPYLIQNNFIQASSENIMFGGADPVITNIVPSDITIIGNLIQKNTAWRNNTSWGAFKNLFELKNAQRVLLDGNVLQYTWAQAQDEAIILRSANQSGACTWCVVQDVTVSHNIIRHAPIGVVLAPAPNQGDKVVPTQRILIRNNLFSDISSVNWGGHGWVFHLSTDTTPQSHDWILDHNTSFSDQALIFLGDAGTVNNVQITNMIADYGSYGIIGNAVGSGTVALTTFLTNYAYNDIVFRTNSTGKYPSGTFWSPNLEVTGFTSYSGTTPNVSGNFQLTSGSPYHNAGTDGKDIGVWDWTCLNYATAAALAGKFVPGAGCGLSTELPRPPTNLNVVVQ